MKLNFYKETLEGAIKEAFEYYMTAKKNGTTMEDVPDAIYTKNGMFKTGMLKDLEHAEKRGWEYVGHPAELRKGV